MASGEELKYRNGGAGLRGLGIPSPYPTHITHQSGAIALTVPLFGYHVLTSDAVPAQEHGDGLVYHLVHRWKVLCGPANGHHIRPNDELLDQA